MKKAKEVWVTTAMGLVNAMKKHRCKGKQWLSSDKILTISYVCGYCGHRVCLRLADLKTEKAMLELFWKAMKTLDGRTALGKALNRPPTEGQGFSNEGFWIQH